MKATDHILAGKQRIHMVGIGGVSMSGLAEILVHLGFQVTGSDIHESNTTAKLSKLGIKVIYGHYEQNVADADLVVHTAAVKADNPELKNARSLGIPIIDRAVLLGHIMKQYSKSIAVSGTHGKTTTTSMISMIMLQAGVDPTIHIGGELDSIGGNTKIGNGPYFIAEACEYVESFLQFYPYLALILNIEEDHLDYFKDLNHILRSFEKFVGHIPPSGYVIGCGDDENTLSVLKTLKCNVYTYGIHSESCRLRAANIVFDEFGCSSFDVFEHNRFVDQLKLKVPGIHNVYNALGAALACRCMGVSFDDIKNGLAQFCGTHRRFETKGMVDNVKVIDDYSHHPTEIRAALKAARNFIHSRIWCVFQPHTYTRTKALLDGFAEAFGDVNTVILTDIYAAREKDNGEIHASVLAEHINRHSNNALYLPSFEAITQYLLENASPGDVILTMGAGDVYKIGEMYLDRKKMAAVS